MSLTSIAVLQDGYTGVGTALTAATMVYGPHLSPPVKDMMLVEHGLINGQGVSVALPSPVYLRWLADWIETAHAQRAKDTAEAMRQSDVANGTAASASLS